MSCRKAYQLEPKYAGLIIGKQGSNIKVLQRMSGVRSVSLDTRSSSRVHTLHVQGINEEACDAVFEKVRSQITSSIAPILCPECF